MVGSGSDPSEILNQNLSSGGHSVITYSRSWVLEIGQICLGLGRKWAEPLGAS